MPIIHRSFESIDSWRDSAAELLASALTAHAPNPAGIILPGGSTPKPIFESVAARGVAAAPNVHIFYSDERMVPQDAPESNYLLTLPLLKALGISLQHVHAVNTQLPLEDAADALDHDIDAFIEAGGAFPLAFLGLGTDGHTASLFSREDLDRAAGRWASPTPRPTPPDRVTVTPATLARVDRIVFLVAGRDKDAVTQQLLDSPTSVIAGQAVEGARHVEVWSV